MLKLRQAGLPLAALLETFGWSPQAIDRVLALAASEQAQAAAAPAAYGVRRLSVAIGPGVLTADVPVGAVAAAERHAGTLALVRARSVAAVDALVNVLSPGRLDDTYTAAEPAAVPALAAAWRTAAATSASVAGDAAAAWGADPAGGLSTVPAPPPGLLPDAAGTAAQLRLTVLIEAKQRIAAGTAPEQALQHARQRAGRGAAGIGARTARTAHEHTLQAAGLGWARIPATNGCPWCLLLASRGPVYTSQRTAQGRVGPYHPWCRCRTLAVPRGTPLAGYLDPGSDVGALVDQAGQAYARGRGIIEFNTSTFARDQERRRRGGAGPGPSAPVRAGTRPGRGNGGAVPAQRSGGELAGSGGSGGGGRWPPAPGASPDDDGWTEQERSLRDTLDRDFQGWAAGLSHPQRQAILRWQGTDRYYGKIQGWLRTGASRISSCGQPSHGSTRRSGRVVLGGR
jgi:hypothetical protein